MDMVGGDFVCDAAKDLIILLGLTDLFTMECKYFLVCKAKFSIIEF